MGCGLWAVGCGLWAVGCGLWAVGCGLWAFSGVAKATPENANNGLVTTKSFGEQTKFFLLMMIVISLSSFLIDLTYFCTAIFLSFNIYRLILHLNFNTLLILLQDIFPLKGLNYHFIFTK